MSNRATVVGTSTMRVGRAGAHLPVAFSDLLVQWINLAKVSGHMHQQEQAANEVQVELDALLIARQRRAPYARSAGRSVPSEGESIGASAASAVAASAAGAVEPASSSASAASSSADAGSTGRDLAARRSALAARRSNLSQLSAKLREEELVMQAMRTSVLQRRQALQPKLAQLQQLQSTAISHRAHLACEKKQLDTDLRVQLHLLHLRCCFRRRLLLHHLLTIYPISPPRVSKSAPTQHPLVCFTIRGLRLPNNFNNILTSFDEEQVSTALGYVCHLLLLLSKYLDVPLRYRMLYRGSRSVICDDVTASSQFPLYFKNMEERRFELGVILLNKNIEHLLNVRLEPTSLHAKHVRELTYTLENLDLLFKSEIPQ